VTKYNEIYAGSQPRDDDDDDDDVDGCRNVGFLKPLDTDNCPRRLR
jgi:hypothetical protein